MQSALSNVGFEILTAVTVKSTIFLGVCRVDWYFAGVLEERTASSFRVQE
jgi:hypothetical protein